ncbi:MAG: PASTA domain-containing protein, partial [Actinobacteria bacterium]|nr:PASTA domain-containing protein [Actinomycetota bacterium]
GSADDQPTTVLPTTTGRGSRGTTYPPYDDVIPRRTAAWVFGSVASILALVAVGLFTFRAVTDENAGANIIVPSVVGMNIEEAKSLLIDLGLVPIEDPRVRDDVPNDVVYEQTPPAETAAAQGDNVVLLYNPGFVPIEVPNLVGLSVEEATTVLKAAGLRLVVNEFIASTEIPANQIIVQTPTAGLGARPNSVVTVDVSGGTNTVRVPDVIGDEQNAAVKLLSASPLNFVIDLRPEASDVIEAGRVIRTEPLGDTAVPPGSTIIVVVSTGKAQIVMPNVVGSDGAVAASSLTSLGLTVQVSEQLLPAGDANVGKVISQTPAAGASVAAGGAVTIVVGKADTTTTVPIATTVP